LKYKLLEIMIPALSKPKSKPMNLPNRLASFPNNCFWTKHEMGHATFNAPLLLQIFGFRSQLACSFPHVRRPCAGDAPSLAQESSLKDKSWTLALQNSFHKWPFPLRCQATHSSFVCLQLFFF